MLEPDAGSAAVFIDEFDAGVFEGALNFPDIRGVTAAGPVVAPRLGYLTARTSN